MPIQVKWENAEKTILMEIIEGDWTLADIYAMLEEHDRMLSEVPHRVDVIVDMRQARFSSADLLSVINRVRPIASFNLGRVVAVGAKHYLKAIAEVASRIVPRSINRMHFVETMDEARALMTDHDAPKM